MNSLRKILTKSGLLTEDLDYHLIRAAMVIIFLFFGYQKWFEYEAQVLIPYQQRPADFLDVPGIRHPGGQLVLRSFGMVVWRSPILRILEQKIGDSRCPRLMRHIHNDRHYHSLYAGWLGRVGRRFSSNDWQRSLPYEGCGAFCCVSLFAETGCIESVAFRQAHR
jgi:hypothetical protein